jgi:hypothetical protein
MYTMDDLSLIKQIVFYLMENIELWKYDFQSIFPNALFKVIEKLVTENIVSDNEEFINDIIYYFIKTIENDDNNICREYINNFFLLTGALENTKIDIKETVISLANQLGTFGKNAILRRYSVFICTCLIRVK